MRHCLLISLVFVLVFGSETGFSQDLSDYLILEDIGPYKIAMPEKLFPGEPPSGGPRSYEGPGIVGATGHFTDHNDRTYTAMYLGGNDDLASPTVQVTKHAGGDSDKWLQHEVVSDFRDYYGLPGDSYAMRVINGNTIMCFGEGGGIYRWISGTKVIQIQYTDFMMTKPEPLEVVNVYLAKHPSTLPSMSSAGLRTDENKTKWIKDEMERRLWLCDKWLQQLDEGKTDQYKALSAVVDDHLEVFLDYRGKYYGISAGEDKGILYQYLEAKNEAGIRRKLNEYKKWWSSKKTRAPAL